VRGQLAKMRWVHIHFSFPEQGCQILQTKMGKIYQNGHKNDTNGNKKIPK
jgi:hypothetical protein